MVFSSRFKVIFIRTFQVLMLVFTFEMFTPTFPSTFSKGSWFIALICWEWFAYNIVRASLDANGFNYYRFGKAKHVSWDRIHSASLRRGAFGVIIALVIRIEGRPLVSRYKFLLDSKPGIEVMVRDPVTNDPIEIVRLRQKLFNSLR